MPNIVNGLGQVKVGVKPTPPPPPSTLMSSIYSAYNADSQGLTSLKTSLYAAYNGESNANDSFGTLNGTAVGGVTYTTGKIGNAFTLNGTNAYVNLPRTTNQFDFTGDFSINVWIKPTANSATYQIFQNFYGTTNTNRYGYNLYLQSGLVRFATYKGNTGALSASVIAQAPTTIVGGTWYHIVITKTTSNAFKIYINGVLQTLTVVEGDLSLTPVYSSLGQVNIGSTFNNGVRSQYFNGQIDALNIWQKELTQSEITELYNSGNGSQYITDNFYRPTTNDALNLRNGTAQGGLTYGVGKVGTAFVGNGSNAYVSAPTDSWNSTIGGDFSVSAWVNLTNVSTQQVIISNLSSISGQFQGWDLRVVNGIPRFNLWRYDIGTLNSSTTIVANTWYHIVITRKAGGAMNIYVNNSKTTTTSITNDPIINSTHYPTICALQYNTTKAGYLSNGSKVDSVNIWTRELSASEITELYNSGTGIQYTF